MGYINCGHADYWLNMYETKTNLCKATNEIQTMKHKPTYKDKKPKGKWVGLTQFPEKLYEHADIFKDRLGFGTNCEAALRNMQ